MGNLVWGLQSGMVTKLYAENIYNSNNKKKQCIFSKLNVHYNILITNWLQIGIRNVSQMISTLFQKSFSVGGCFQEIKNSLE